MSIDTNGIAEVQAKLAALPGKLQEQLAAFVATRANALKGAVQANIASMFKTGSGALSNAVQVEVSESGPDNFSYRVWMDTSRAPYANIQEQGGTTAAHVITPRNAKALAFAAGAGGGGARPTGGAMRGLGGNLGDGLVFAKRVNHPGSRIPEHPFLRNAIAAEQPIFEDGVRAIVDAVTAS